MANKIIVQKDFIAFYRILGGDGSWKRQPHYSDYGRTGRYLINKIAVFPEFGDLQLQLRLRTGANIEDGPILQMNLVDQNRLELNGKILKLVMEFYGEVDGQWIKGIMKFKIPSIVQGYEGQGPSDDDFRRVHGYYSSRSIPANTRITYIIRFKFEDAKRSHWLLRPFRSFFGLFPKYQ